MSKVLFIDIETSFKLAGVWGLWDQNVGLHQIFQDTYILNWSAKWLDDEYIYTDALFYHPEVFKNDPTDDSAIMETIWELLDEADYVIGHNGDRFDIPHLNAKFIKHGMKPPSSYKTIDTLKIAKRNFKFTSNKLDELGKTLGVGEKMDTGGFKLWVNIVMKGCIKSFKKMVLYCEQDVLLLERVYLELSPWHKNHPSMVIDGDLTVKACNVCKSIKIKKNGTYLTNTQRYQKYACCNCGHSMRDGKALKLTKEQKSNLLRSV